MDLTTMQLYKAENEAQRARNLVAEALSENTPLSRKMFIVKHRHGIYSEIGPEMARCPFMNVEVLRELYSDYPYLVSINPQTPAYMMDPYTDSGLEDEQIGCFAYKAQADQLSDDQWIRLSRSQHVGVRRRLARSVFFLPTPARVNLLEDDDYLVREIANDAMERGRRNARREIGL